MMTQSEVFAAGTASALLIAFVVVVYLRGPLKAILVDLCAAEERARFWMAFSCVTIILTPLIFAMHMRPDPEEPVPAMHQLSMQLEGALIGLVAAVLVLGFVISQFIPRGPAVAPAKHAPLDKVPVVQGAVR